MTTTNDRPNRTAALLCLAFIAFVLYVMWPTIASRVAVLLSAPVTTVQPPPKPAQVRSAPVPVQAAPQAPVAPTRAPQPPTPAPTVAPQAVPAPAVAPLERSVVRQEAGKDWETRASGQTTEAAPDTLSMDAKVVVERAAAKAAGIFGDK